MLSFPFWNVNGKPLTDLIVRLAEEHRVDVLILAECQIAPTQVLLGLNALASPMFHYAPGVCPRILIFTRFSSHLVRSVAEDEWLTIRSLAFPARPEILLAAVHLTSKLFWTAESQSLECTSLSSKIGKAEKLVGHDRTVLVGDFNMNPFESGMVGAGGLHGMMSRRIAEKGSRTVQGQSHPFFYNPMWAHFGDRAETVAGTYYYERNEHVTYFWNMFDQVMVRPSLAERISPEQVEILTAAGGTTLLLKDGRPNRTTRSDHLPLLFTLSM